MLSMPRNLLQICLESSVESAWPQGNLANRGLEMFTIFII